MEPSTIWIAGFPSHCGGADTELSHQIDLFLRHDWNVHLVPMYSAAEDIVVDLQRRGCGIHTFDDGIFTDKIVASWCNGNFLEALPRIFYAGKPRKIVWFNCMTWLFPREIEAHERSWLDVFGFVSAYQRDILAPKLEKIGSIDTFDYRPWTNPCRFEGAYREWSGSYRIGRLSRDDATKFSDDTWKLYGTVEVPRSLRKEIRIMGFGPNARVKLGAPPASLNAAVFPPNFLPPREFLAEIDVLLHRTGGSRESYGRAVIEAMASSVVPIVENDFAFPEFIVDGETGYLEATSEDMSERATWLAHHPEVHRRVARAAREYVVELSKDEQCIKGWQSLIAND